jgi:hypothetical protein
VQALDIALTEEDEEVIEYRLTFQVNYELYQRIDKEALFNLKPEVRGSIFGGGFQPEQEIEIEAALNSDLLPEMLVHGKTAHKAANYLTSLSQNHLGDSLLETENWYGLYVKQSVPLPPELAEDGAKLKTGYSTSWANQVYENENFLATGSIFDVLIDFFSEESWAFTELVGQTTLKLTFSGDNGEWDFYAQANEDYNECGFYSVYPEKIPEQSRLAVAEYLTRANYGMPVGNFEMDLDTGEVRCKTSIDLGSERLTDSLMQRLLKVNVSLMDQYFLGIKRIIHENLSPTKAIAQIQSQSK